MTGQPLPEYRHQPGRSPHPTRDPAGHSYGVAEPWPVRAFDARRARGDPRFERGVELFDAGYFWEAHEVWEGAWRLTPRGTADRELLHGLIQVAAALLHLRGGRWRAARRVGERGIARLETSIGGPGVDAVLGSVHVTALVAAVREALEGARDTAPSIPRG